MEAEKFIHDFWKANEISNFSKEYYRVNYDTRLAAMAAAFCTERSPRAITVNKWMTFSNTIRPQRSPPPASSRRNSLSTRPCPS